jgi:hypothetical protein
MKKILSTATILLFVFAGQAQDNFDPLRDRQFNFDVLNICSILAVIYLISSFILQVVKQHYNFRIKNRILDKGTEENIVRELLQPDKKETRNSTLQWFFMLAAIGIGLLLVALFRPFGLHSAAILAISLAAGFGAQFWFTRKGRVE